MVGKIFQNVPQYNLPNHKTPTDKTWLTDRVGRTFYKPKK